MERLGYMRHKDDDDAVANGATEVVVAVEPTEAEAMSGVTVIGMRRNMTFSCSNLVGFRFR
jgi:hypothetical protein